jgi:hypothetical protein
MIYELDLELLEQLAKVLRGTKEEVIPAIRDTLTPIINAIPSPGGNLDPASLLGLAAMAVKGATFEASVSTTLGNLDFINVGKFKHVMQRCVLS